MPVGVLERDEKNSLRSALGLALTPPILSTNPVATVAEIGTACMAQRLERVLDAELVQKGD